MKGIGWEGGKAGAKDASGLDPTLLQQLYSSSSLRLSPSSIREEEQECKHEDIKWRSDCIEEAHMEAIL